MKTHHRIQQKNIRGVACAEVLSGEILVPLNDELRKKLKNAPLTCTILDGGVVTIKDVIPANSISKNGFKKCQIYQLN